MNAKKGMVEIAARIPRHSKLNQSLPYKENKNKKGGEGGNTRGKAGMEDPAAAFLNRTLQISLHSLPGDEQDPSAAVVTLADVENWMDDYWMSRCQAIHGVMAVDLRPLYGLKETFETFLPRYVDLVHVDLAPMVFLQTIGDYFMFDCRRLVSIDLAPLVNLKSIGKSFLNGCVSLKRVDLAPLEGLSHIPDCFLMGCQSLAEIDLSPLKNVRGVGDYFLHGCSSLVHVDCGRLEACVSIGRCFMQGCSKLQSVNFSGILRVGSVIGDCFLHSCPDITLLIVNSNSRRAADTTIPSSQDRIALAIERTSIEEMTVPIRRTGTLASKMIATTSQVDLAVRLLQLELLAADQRHRH